MLINCIAYQKGARIGAITIEDISDYLAKPETFVWVALHDPSAEELAKMQEEFNLHDLAIEDALHGRQRPKVEEYGNTVFAVVHMIEHIGDELEVGEVNIFAGLNFVLSVRTHTSRDLLGVRARCEREPHMLELGSGFVFYAIVDAVVDRYFPLVDEMVYEIEKIEEHIFESGSTRETIRELYKLKRKTMVIKHAIAPLLEGVGKLVGGRIPYVCRNTTDYFRDVFDHLTRLNATVDSLHDMIVTAMQVNFSMVTIEDNEVNKKLAAWAGIFAVVTAFVGVWGMNFKYMPELDWEYGYPLALTMISTICAVLYYRFKRSGWL